MPVLVGAEKIAEFNEGYVVNLSLPEESLNAFLRRLRLCVHAHTGTVWTETNIHNGFDAVYLEELQKLLWFSSPVTNSE